ncbi:MAG: YmaF family protein [Patescibacteria group bacterium]
MSYEMHPSGRTHVHEYAVSSSIDDGHYHRAAGVSGEEIPYGNSHIHELAGWTTYDQGHLHCYRFFTGPEIPVSGEKHVHFFDHPTETAADHVHTLEDATRAAED